MARHSPRRHRCLALSGALGLGLLPCLGLLVRCGGAGAPAPDAPVSLEVTPTSPDMVPASDHGYDLFGPGPDTFRVSARDAAGSPFPGTTFQARVVPGDVARVLRLPDGLGNSFRLEPLETGRAATLPEPPFLNATVPTGPPIRLASIRYSCQPALPDSSRSPSMPKAPSGSMPGPGTPSTPSPPRQSRAPSRYPTYLAACVWWAWACCRSRPFRSGSRLQLPAGGHWQCQRVIGCHPGADRPRGLRHHPGYRQRVRRETSHGGVHLGDLRVQATSPRYRIPGRTVANPGDGDLRHRRHALAATPSWDLQFWNGRNSRTRAMPSRIIRRLPSSTA